MKKIINKKTYNTDTAVLLGHITFGVFGDTDGFEEKLFKTKSGNHFIYGLGGVSSKYPAETIIPLSLAEANEWIKNN